MLSLYLMCYLHSLSTEISFAYDLYIKDDGDVISYSRSDMKIMLSSKF